MIFLLGGVSVLFKGWSEDFYVLFFSFSLVTFILMYTGLVTIYL